VDKHIQQKGFTVISLDESFFFYDSFVSGIWIEENNRPIVKVTGSHKYSCIFGAVTVGKTDIQTAQYSMEIHFYCFVA
jgi:hypothetical protein